MGAGEQAPRGVVAAVATAILILFVAARLTTGAAEHLKESAIRDLLALGDTHAREQRDTAAAQSFRRALALDAGSFEARLGLVRALLRLGQWQEAQGHLNQLHKADPASSQVNLLSARAAVQAGDANAASDHYHRAVYGYWAPGDMEQRLATRMEMVRHLALQNDRDALIPELLRLQREAPDDDPLRRDLAGLMLEAGMAAEAAVQYRQLLAAEPRDAELQFGLAEAEIHLGNHLRALQVLRSLVRQQPDHARAAARLALCERIVSTDPLARRVSLSERHRRSGLLIHATLGRAEACGGMVTIAPLVDDARQEAQETYRAVTAETTIERNLQTAERLWRMLPASCREATSEDDPLPHIFATIERGSQ